MRLIDYFFKNLPDYFFYYDSYKRDDITGFTDRPYGLLERYMAAIQEDAEVADADITGIPDLAFPLTTEVKYLSYIASLFRYPSDTLDTDEDKPLYRELLRNIIDINKVRGTLEGIRRFFEIMGVTVSVTVRQAVPVYYDNGSFYDTGVAQTDPINYDSACFPCAWISFVVTSDTYSLLDPGGGYTDNHKRAIQSILVYLLPINAIIDEDTALDAWRYGGSPQDIQLSDNMIKFKRTI